MSFPINYLALAPALAWYRTSQMSLDKKTSSGRDKILAIFGLFRVFICIFVYLLGIFERLPKDSAGIVYLLPNR